MRSHAKQLLVGLGPGVRWGARVCVCGCVYTRVACSETQHMKTVNSTYVYIRACMFVYLCVCGCVDARAISSEAQRTVMLNRLRAQRSIVII